MRVRAVVCGDYDCVGSAAVWFQWQGERHIMVAGALEK